MTPVAIGYVPLVDAAPVIVAKELGFAEEEGLALSLVKAASWSQLRDMLDSGRVQAAHMLSVMPVARALGLGGGAGATEVLMVLSLGGQVIGLSAECAARARVGFGDPMALGAALAGQDLRLGVPFPFSMQALLLRYWLQRAAPGLQPRIVTVPPSRMAEALRAGDIDGFCVGEPWGSAAATEAGARLVLTGSQIWSQAPEKVLAVRAGQGEEAGPLMRAVWRAGRWAEAPGNRATLADILARPAYLDVAAAYLEPALFGRVGAHQVPQLLTFHDGVANFPWRSQASWIGAELARSCGLPLAPAVTAARACFRSDLYRRHLGALAPMPRSSDKLEGALSAAEALPAVNGRLILARNRFFDGAVFDPEPEN